MRRHRRQSLRAAPTSDRGLRTPLPLSTERTPLARHDGRQAQALRPVDIQVGFHQNAEGSVLYRCGKTRVLCTASLEDSLPKWMEEGDGGWLTAEYQMHPRANPQRRENREGRGRPPKGRTMEIQRLIGRALRSAMDLKAFGSRMITVDCDVLEADGGTRTASVTGGFMATAMAIHSMGLARVMRDQVAAVSVGYVDGQVLTDLDYVEDSAARVDMNVVATRK
ncbi:MAG: ribonuclease PH, partial [Polyangiaceae bacterium]